jgi:outer membrane protein OmpA-like peptidoglycan-associated protein
MADITLAEFNGRVWLVGGEAHLQDLLANTLPQQVTVELLQCERPSEVHDLWVQHCGASAGGGMPWQINPSIVARVRRRSSDFAVFFAQWSVQLDQDALAVIAAAAAWAEENPALPVVLAEYLDPGGPRAIADLSQLRAQFIADKLVESGLDRRRVSRAQRPISDVDGMPQESQRIDIVIRPD